jgi:hypothetical protein
MSLDFKLTDIADWKEVCYNEGKMTAEAESVIFATMAVGIGHITEKSYVEFSVRAQVVAGVAEFGGDAYRALTPEVLHKYIGLRTNVCYEQEAKWIKRVLDGTRRTACWHESKRLMELEVAAAA